MPTASSLGGRAPFFFLFPAALAAYGRRARFVPMYTAELLRILEHIVEDSAVELLLLADGFFFITGRVSGRSQSP